MADAAGETNKALRVAFDRRLKLEFHGARITPDGGLLAYRELDEALGPTATAAPALAEGRRSKNVRRRLLGLLRQAVYSPSPATRTSTMPSGSPATRRCAPSSAGKGSTARRPGAARWAGSRPSGWPTEANLAMLTELPGAWIDRVHARRPPDGIVLDMDSSE